MSDRYCLGSSSTTLIRNFALRLQGVRLAARTAAPGDRRVVDRGQLRQRDERAERRIDPQVQLLPHAAGVVGLERESPLLETGLADDEVHQADPGPTCGTGIITVSPSPMRMSLAVNRRRTERFSEVSCTSAGRTSKSVSVAVGDGRLEDALEVAPAFLGLDPGEHAAVGVVVDAVELHVRLGRQIARASICAGGLDVNQILLGRDDGRGLQRLALRMGHEVAAIAQIVRKQVLGVLVGAVHQLIGAVVVPDGRRSRG